MHVHERMKIVLHKGKEIVILDYSDLREEEMMQLLSYAKERVLEEGKLVLIGSIFNQKNFVTPKFMRFTESVLKETEKLVVKNSITGISQTQVWILKGINMWYRRKLQAFKTKEELLEYLASE